MNKIYIGQWPICSSTIHPPCDCEFSASLSRRFYVDDLVLGCTDVYEGKVLYEKCKDRMKEGGFNFRKWKTNDQSLAGEFKDNTENIKLGV